MAKRKRKYNNDIMNEPLIECKNYQNIINNMANGEFPNHDIQCIRCANCRKIIEKDENFFKHCQENCPGSVLKWQFEKDKQVEKVDGGRKRRRKRKSTKKKKRRRKRKSTKKKKRRRRRK